MKKVLLAAIICCCFVVAKAQKVDFSVVSVPQESGIDFTCLTTENDYVCMPIVRRTRTGIEWLTNRILDVSNNGKNLAYLSVRNNTTNVFIKDIDRQGSSMQRTNREAVLDFSYSADGNFIVFSEMQGKLCQIFRTDAKNGYVCRQITSANNDYSPIYSKDMRQIFFARTEQNGVSVWGYNVQNNFVSSFTRGMNPYPLDSHTLLCTRPTQDGRCEIWRVDYENGTEECLVSDPHRSFTSPCLSPNGSWILMTGSSEIITGHGSYWNTDIYACRIDGTQLLQLTYHAADDLSPVWSKDGRFIYFISQRGSADATANVWRMPFINE